MASNISFVEYIAEQLHSAGEITYRKMFGEYGLYLNGKFFAVICDDRFFIKITEGGRNIAPDLKESPPYDGAKNYFLIDDIDNRDFLVKLAVVTCENLPEPKPKKRRK